MVTAHKTNLTQTIPSSNSPDFTSGGFQSGPHNQLGDGAADHGDDGNAATAIAGDRSYSAEPNAVPVTWTDPYFDAMIQKNVTALVGKSAYLSCKVRNLGNKTVS